MKMIICQTCKTEKPENDFHCKGKYSSKPALCKLCFQKKDRERAKAWYRNPEVKEQRRRYCKKKQVKDYIRSYNDKPEVKERMRLYNSKPEVRKQRKRYKKSSIALANKSYIKMLIRRKSENILKSKDIPSDLIEAQRQSLILKRTIKQKQDEQCNNTSDL